MPNQPKTPGHTIRVPDDEWLPARDKAAENGETMTGVIRRALRKYVSGAVLGALILASFSGSAQASAPVAVASMSTASFVATVRQAGAGTVVDYQSDADLITMGKWECDQTATTFWSRVDSAYSVRNSESAGVSSYAQWMSFYGAWRQSSVATFCPQHR